jgi:hypothetical protein
VTESPDGRERQARLDRVFRAYRDACPDPDPGANFMPMVWDRIERTRSTSIGFRRIAQAFVTAAFALSLLMALLAVAPREQPSASSRSYIEVLAEHHDTGDIEDSESGVL